MNNFTLNDFIATAPGDSVDAFCESMPRGDRVFTLTHMDCRKIKNQHSCWAWVATGTDYTALEGIHKVNKVYEFGDCSAAYWLAPAEEYDSDKRKNEIKHKYSEWVNPDQEFNKVLSCDYGYIGLRPVVVFKIKNILELHKKYPQLCKIYPRYLNPKCYLNGNLGTAIIEFGEYPQNVPDCETQRQLIKLHKSNQLTPTGKQWLGSISQNAVKFNDEYEYNGKKYVKVDLVPGLCFSREGRLAYVRENKRNGFCKDGDNWDYVFVQVQPIRWEIEGVTKTYNPNKDENVLLTVDGLHFTVKGDNALAVSHQVLTGQILYNLDKQHNLYNDSLIRAYLNGLDITYIKQQKFYNEYVTKLQSELGEIDFKGKHNFINEAFSNYLELINLNTNSIQAEDNTKSTHLIRQMINNNAESLFSLTPKMKNLHSQLKSNPKDIYNLNATFIANNELELENIVSGSQELTKNEKDEMYAYLKKVMKEHNKPLLEYLMENPNEFRNVSSDMLFNDFSGITNFPYDAYKNGIITGEQFSVLQHIAEQKQNEYFIQSIKFRPKLIAFEDKDFIKKYRDELITAVKESCEFGNLSNEEMEDIIDYIKGYRENLKI